MTKEDRDRISRYAMSVQDSLTVLIAAAKRLQSRGMEGERGRTVAAMLVERTEALRTSLLPLLRQLVQTGGAAIDLDVLEQELEEAAQG